MLEESTGNFSASRNVYDWYQTNTHVILNIMIKNLTEADVKVRLIDETLDVNCQLANRDEYRLHFNLFKPIYVAESSWTVTPSKLEIKLKKTDRKRWQSLEVVPEKGCKRPPSFAGVVTPNPKKPLLEATDSSSLTNELGDMPITVGKLKYDWYQNDGYVMVSVLIKNINENDVKVQFSDSTLELDVRLPDGAEQKLHLNLFKQINNEESTCSVSASKLEMKLKKLDATRWSKLEADEPVKAEAPRDVLPTTIITEVTDEAETAQQHLLEQVAAMEQTVEEVPVGVAPEEGAVLVTDGVVASEIVPEASEIVPEASEIVPEAHVTDEEALVAVSNGVATESQISELVDDEPPVLEPQISIPSPKATTAPGQAKNWDKIVKDLEEEEKTNPGEGSVDELFREIYEKGGEEVRRAMNKSFVESSGTVLSTNWNEVAKDKVTVKPPDGVEFKKWE